MAFLYADGRPRRIAGRYRRGFQGEVAASGRARGRLPRQVALSSTRGAVSVADPAQIGAILAGRAKNRKQRAGREDPRLCAD